MKTALTGLFTFGACQAARVYLDRSSRKEADFAAGHVRLTALKNKVGAFGLPLSREVLMSLSGAVLGTLWTQRHRCPIGAGLVLGGGLSNLLERARHKAVYDYVQFPKAPGKLKRYVFNLADFAIIAGSVAIALRTKHHG